MSDSTGAGQVGVGRGDEAVLPSVLVGVAPVSAVETGTARLVRRPAPVGSPPPWLPWPGDGSPRLRCWSGSDLARYPNVRVAEKITCRTLVMDGTGEAFSVGQAKLLHDALRCPKDYLLFTAEDTGLLHVQEGAYAVANQRMFDWLDEYF